MHWQNANNVGTKLFIVVLFPIAKDEIIQSPLLGTGWVNYGTSTQCEIMHP